MDHNYTSVVMVDRACGDEGGGRAEDRMWQKIFAVHTYVGTICQHRPWLMQTLILFLWLEIIVLHGAVLPVHAV